MWRLSVQENEGGLGCGAEAAPTKESALRGRKFFCPPSGKAVGIGIGAQ